MNVVEVKMGPYTCKIGQPNEKGYVNIFMNFLALDHLNFVQELRKQEEVEFITNVMDHMDGTGSLSLKLTKTANETDLQSIFQILLFKYF